MPTPTMYAALRRAWQAHAASGGDARSFGRAYGFDDATVYKIRDDRGIGLRYHARDAERERLLREAGFWPGGGEPAQEPALPAGAPTSPQDARGAGEGEDMPGDPFEQGAPVPEPRRLSVVMTPKDFDRLGGADPEAPRVRVVQAPRPFDPVDLGRRVFSRMEEESAAYLSDKADHPPDLVVIDVETSVPVALVNLSDLHFGHKGTDHRRAREDAELVKQTPGVFAVFGGDGIDNFIKHQSALVNKGSEPESEYAALEYWLSIFGDRMLAGVTGNHDFWTKNLAGVDYLRQIFRRLGIHYAKHRLRLILRVNGIPYRIELRHSYRFKSSINLSNQLQRMWEMSDWEWDVGCVGHTHDGPFCFPFVRHGVERWGGLAGAYKTDDSHGQQWGFNDARASSPVFILNHRQRGIVGVPDLRTGIAHLSALRRAA